MRRSVPYEEQRKPSRPDEEPNGLGGDKIDFRLFGHQTPPSGHLPIETLASTSSSTRHSDFNFSCFGKAQSCLLVVLETTPYDSSRPDRPILDASLRGG